MRQEQFGYISQEDNGVGPIPIAGDIIAVLKHMLDKNDPFDIPVLLHPTRAIPEERLAAAYHVIEKREDRMYARSSKHDNG